MREPKFEKKIDNYLEQMIQRTADYILSLPNGASTSLREASKSACGFDAWDACGDLFDACDEIINRAEKTGLVLDFSAYDGMVVGLPFNVDFIVWRPRLKNARIISDMLCFGSRPMPEDPAEQRLTISSTGRVWFSEYLSGNGTAEKKPLGRRLQCSIGKERAAAILSMPADSVSLTENSELCQDICNIGLWEMILTDVDGNQHRLSASMNGLCVKDINSQALIDLTGYICERIPIKGIVVFGTGSGGGEEDA